MASVCDLVTDVTPVTAARKPARYLLFQSSKAERLAAKAEPIR